MTRLDLAADVVADPDAWARALDIDVEAVELYRSSEVVDLHLDSFIWTRIVGYDLHRRHDRPPLGRRYAWQVDLPRALEAGVTGAIWSVTTNPFRPATARRDAFAVNRARLIAELDAHPGVEVVRSVADHRAARARGAHGAFIGIQGGNALSSSLDDLDGLGVDVVRVTLVHLTNSRLGTTSSPLSRLGGRPGLTGFGREVVERLDAERVLVDLAHMSEPGFWAAVDAHDPSVPLIVTHTGVDGVHRHWRNLTDEQVRAVAGSGGCIGVMLQESFLGSRPTTVGTVVDHLDHIVKIAGDGAAAIGTDLDGLVTPPKTLARHSMFPRLVHEMRRRGWPEPRVRAVLGGNALRTIEAVRG